MKQCKVCNSELTKRYQKMYCSNSCKFKDKEYNASRTTIKQVNKTDQAVQCIVDGWCTYDINNTSGSLIKHLKKLKIEDAHNYEKYYKPIIKPRAILFNCPECDWTTPDSKNESGAITKHIKRFHNTTISEFLINHPDLTTVFFHQGNLIQRSFELETPDNAVTCQECGVAFKKITRTHLKQMHNMTLLKYTRKYGEGTTFSTSLKEKHRVLRTELNKTSTHTFISKAERELKEALESKGVNCISSVRSKGPEIDILLVDHNIGVEFDGLLYHSQLYGKKHPSYHSGKTEFYAKQGIHIIHVFEDEWYRKKQVVINRILHACNKLNPAEKIYARNCIIDKNISHAEREVFLQQNHLQGTDRSSIIYGLRYKNELVSLMTFSGTRTPLGRSADKKCYELVRFASKMDSQVIGGASKLIKCFVKDYNPTSIVSYGDLRWINPENNLYKSLGFTEIKRSVPSYWYMKTYSTRLHRYNFTKHRIVNSLGGDPTKSEWENMQLFGYDRIWDCGTIKYEYTPVN